ncbi:MAG TPA: hypothetical protein VFD43_09780 [Planctomycetota bacterium]|nr:hypothetical protein [Planctomycetota bacterium]
MDARERVAEESDRFYKALPRLLKSRLRGRWVLFLDGDVQADFGDEWEAYREGIARFGIDGGFVVARVEPQRVIWITDAHRLFK